MITKYIMKIIILIFSLLISFSSVTFASIYDNYNDSIECYQVKDYGCALIKMEYVINDRDFDPSIFEFAEYIVGNIYLNGKGVPKDWDKGVNYYEKVIRRNSTSPTIKGELLTNLAWAYNTDVDYRNYEKSRYYANESIKYGETFGLNNYGVFLEEGIIFERDDYRAFEYYKKSSEQENPAHYAFSNLGRFYTLGLGPARKSLEKAKINFTKARALSDDTSTADSYLRVLNRYNKLPSGIQEMKRWLEEDVYKYGSSNFLVIGWVIDQDDRVDGLSFFILQEMLGEDIDDRDRARELIARDKELLNDPELFKKAQEKALKWKEKYWDNYNEEEAFPFEEDPPLFAGLDKGERVPVASGTGFFISNDGYVVTNHHVINECGVVKLDHQGKQIDIDVIAFDRINDLALLKSDLDTNSYYRISDKDVVLLQDIIIAGYPLGKEVSATIKTSKGSVTSLAGFKDNYSEFQTDAALNSGNSGGPIIDETGSVVGIAVADYGANEGVESFNFGIKSSVLRNFLGSNGIAIENQNKRNMNNSDLSSLISTATVYLECWMTLSKLETILEVDNSKASFYSKYKN